tara:strand:- start:252 stop:527 length:276 start_codon:yes stop_codon:yes gene_type:complete
MITRERVNEILSSKKWKFAKTMKSIPHSYILEKHWNEEEKYQDVADFITEHGEKRLFFRRFYYYYQLDGHEYWSMKISDGTGIINRAEINV